MPNKPDAEIDRLAEEHAREKYKCRGRVLDSNTTLGISDFLAGAEAMRKIIGEENATLRETLGAVAKIDFALVDLNDNSRNVLKTVAKMADHALHKQVRYTAKGHELREENQALRATVKAQETKIASLETRMEVLRLQILGVEET